MMDNASNVICPSIPAEIPCRGNMFGVTVCGHEVGLYSDRTYWNGCVDFGRFFVSQDSSAEVVVEPHFTFTSVKILPIMLGITPQVTNGRIRFTVSKTPAQITLIFDDSYVAGNVLHLFADKIAPYSPSEVDDVLYFPAGFHDVRQNGSALEITSNTTVYLEPGAVVYGGIRAAGENIRIFGGGMIMVDKDCSSIALDAVQCERLVIEDVMIHTHAKNGWNAHLYLCKDVEVSNVKILSTTYACTDGLDISNGRNIHVHDSFIRSCDDSISLKGFERSLACENIEIENMILWNDCNSSMVVGEESKAAYYRSITFRNIDVLFSYDDPQYHEQLTERSVMSIVLLDGVECKDVLWENVRVNKCERLACFVFRDNFWFGTVKGDQSADGKVDGVALRNIRVFCNSGSRIANEILIEGYDDEKRIENIELRLVQIMGVEIDENDPRIRKNDHVQSVTVSRSLT